MVTQPEHWPLLGEGYHMAYFDRLFTVTIGKRCEPAKVVEMADELGRSIDLRSDSDRLVVMYHVPGDFRSDIAAIKRLSDVVKTRQDKLRRTTIALALATQSVAARAMFRTLLTFAGLPYSYSVVDTPRAGFDYLRQFLPLEERTYDAYVAATRDL